MKLVIIRIKIYLETFFKNVLRPTCSFLNKIEIQVPIINKKSKILTSSKLLLSTTLTINSDGPMKTILLPSGLTDSASGPRLSPRATVFANRRRSGKLSAVASYSAKEPREQALNR